MGSSLNTYANQIEEMCSGQFVMTRTSQKSNIITQGLKNTLGEFRSMTGDTVGEMRKVVNDIMSIG